MTPTALQVVVFWGVFLLVVASSLGIASALAMVLQGRGTPLPIDGPRHLVVRGPYARVRNPMAVAGLAQGAAVALWLGSPLVLAYVIAGGVLRHWFVRPLEESHLLATFGAEYGAYRARVPLWLPRRTSAQLSDGARAGDSRGRR